MHFRHRRREMRRTNVTGRIIFIECQQKSGLPGAKIGREISNNDSASVKQS
jgi:hypothetical protein